MRILFVTPPPHLPNKLHRNRSFELIKILAKRHKVILFSVTSSKKESKELNELKKICKVKTFHLNIFKSILNCLIFPHLPAEVAYCNSFKVREALNELIIEEKIDLVYLKRLRSVVYLPKTNIPVILDSTDAMSMFYLRMGKGHAFPKNLIYRFESIRYKFYEKKVMKKIKNWIVCSDIDRKHLDNMASSLRISVVPNPVDLKYFSTPSPRRSSFGPPSEVSTSTNHQSQITNHSLLFRGLMDKPVNVTAVKYFVKSIFPLVKKEIKDLKLYIVGPNPKFSVRKLANNEIIVTGLVKDDRDFFWKASVVITPVVIGSGTRFKIIQSWAMGKPVISTKVGAEGLNYRDGEDILIADNPLDFAKKIILLFKDKKLYTKLAKNGKISAKKYYSLEAVEKKLKEIVSDVKKRNKKN